MARRSLWAFARASLSGAAALTAAACGSETGVAAFAGAPDDDAEEALMLEEDIRELEGILATLPPEEQTELRQEIAYLRAEMAAARSNGPRGAPAPEVAGAPLPQMPGGPAAPAAYAQPGRAAQPPAFAAGGEQWPQGAAQPHSNSHAGGQAVARPQSGALPSGTWRVKPFRVMDHTGFDKPLVAGAILAPADWSEEGGIIWNANDPCNSSGYNVNFRVKSADGMSFVALFPRDQWVWASIGAVPGGCRTEQFDSAESYLRGMIPRVRSDARLVEYRRRDDIVRELSPLASEMPMAGGGMRTYPDAGEATIVYVENGVEIKELVGVAIIFTENWMDPSFGMPGYQSRSGATMPGFAYRAPSDRFDATFAEAVRLSYRPGAEWTRRINQHHAVLNRQNAETSRNISEINRRTSAEIMDMQMKGYRNRDASGDRIQRETIEGVRGVETYDDPYSASGQVELDFSYDQAWRLNDGTYVLTNDASFAPLRDLGVDGQQLKTSQ